MRRRKREQQSFAGAMTHDPHSAMRQREADLRFFRTRRAARESMLARLRQAMSKTAPPWPLSNVAMSVSARRLPVRASCLKRDGF